MLLRGKEGFCLVTGWLTGIEIFGYNLLEWMGLLFLGFLLVVVVLIVIKRVKHVAVTLDIHQEEDAPHRPSVPIGKEKIVVMDDDPLTLQVLQQHLTALGYQVVTFDNGEKTVAYMRNNGADLLLLDVVMGTGIDGIETYRQVRSRRPMQRAIMLSGQAAPKQVSYLRNMGVESYLVKPINLPLLATAIRAELDRP